MKGIETNAVIRDAIRANMSKSCPAYEGDWDILLPLRRWSPDLSKSCPAYEGDWDQVSRSDRRFLSAVKIMPRLWRGLRLGWTVFGFRRTIGQNHAPLMKGIETIMSCSPTFPSLFVKIMPRLWRGLRLKNNLDGIFRLLCQNHAPLMKGIETTCLPLWNTVISHCQNHAPLMKGIETRVACTLCPQVPMSQNHAPLMKGIETFSTSAQASVKNPSSKSCPAYEGDWDKASEYSKSRVYFVKIMPRLWRGLRHRGSIGIV